MDYPNILITTSLSDNRVLFDEPAKFTAKLRDYKTDNNLLLLKTEMSAGHSGKSGRDGAIEEIALDYAFALKISKKLEKWSWKIEGNYYITSVSRLLGLSINKLALNKGGYNDK